MTCTSNYVSPPGYCHNPNDNTTQTQQYSWVGREKYCAYIPPQKVNGGLHLLTTTKYNVTSNNKQGHKNNNNMNTNNNKNKLG